MKWITREKIKVDRVACPWLIRNFIDEQAQFVFLPPETDWSQIVALYDLLLAVSPTPVVALNRAIAVGEVEGPGRALTTP